MNATTYQFAALTEDKPVLCRRGTVKAASLVDALAAALAKVVTPHEAKARSAYAPDYQGGEVAMVSLGSKFVVVGTSRQEVAAYLARHAANTKQADVWSPAYLAK